MAPSTSNWHDLSSLATLLRDSGDRVLSGDSKLRLTPALLTKLNSAFSSISLLSSNGDFQVTSAHASQPPTTAQIHFLHDFVQKTIGLTIAGNGHSQSDLLRSQPVDLSRFRSLRHLELRSCTLSHGSDPDQGLEGLSSLRLQLEALVLLHIYHQDDLLWAVLADGAVSVGPDVIWTKLSQLVISYCGLRAFGRGLSLACNLQWLDVSHNMLSDADAISSSLAALPSLCYLNLSFNRLTRIPVPSYGSACPMPTKIQILLISHNYIADLNGIQNMTSLRELNLEVNQLESHSSLQPLHSLYQLQHIKLSGNPLSFHKRHRILASSYMHPRAVFLKHRYRRDAVKLIPFMLDGQKLTELELQAVRDSALPSSDSSHRSDHVSIDTSTEPVDRTPESSRNGPSERERSTTRKTRKVREVIIDDFDTLEELTDKKFPTNQMAGSIELSGEHLQTKRQLEIVKQHYKDDWLRAHAGSTVQELLGLQPSSGMPVSNLGSSVASITSSSRPLSSSTPLVSPGLHLSMPLAAQYPSCVVEKQLLDSIIFKRSPHNQEQTVMSHTTQSSQYHTANDSDTVLHISTGIEETTQKEVVPVLSSEIGYEGDDEDINYEDDVNDAEDIEGGDSSKYLVTKITQDQQSRDLFLLTTSRFIKEIDPNSGVVIQSWRIHCLESSVLLSVSPCHVQLTFRTVVPNKRKRIYEMDPDEAQKQLLPSLKAILESRSLTALNVAAFRCMTCSGEFSLEIDSRKAKKCSLCGSTFVFEFDEAPLPSLGSAAQVSSKSQATVATDPTAILEPTSELLHSPSDSSIGSAVSLESPGSVVQPTSEYVSTINAGLRRCESDIDIISNPSQSSIEILDDVSRTSGTPGRKRSSEERQVVAIPSLVTVPEVSNPLTPLPAGLTESSSSGSVTDSVCTAYETSTGTGGMGLRRGAQGLAKSVLKEESSRENSPRYNEEPEVVEPSLQPTSLLDNLLQTMSSKISASENMEKKLRKKISVPDSTVQYNYTDFATVDHRLKLHLHLVILDADEREVIQFLLRGEVVMGTPENRYPGILLISSQKVYIMKITGPEEGDAVDRWISRVVALPRDKLQSICALPWGAGISLTLQGSSLNNVMIVLRDQQYTHNVFTFLKQLSEEPPPWNIRDCPPEKHGLRVAKILQDIVKDELADADLFIQLVVLLNSSTVSKDDEAQNQSGGSLCVTKSSLLLNCDDLTWLMPPEFSSSQKVNAKCIGKQSISNLIQVEADEVSLWLQFLDEAAGGEETWMLSLESEAVLEEIVAAIRPSWEELFSVPLQVLPFTEN